MKVQHLFTTRRFGAGAALLSAVLFLSGCQPVTAPAQSALVAAQSQGEEQTPAQDQAVTPAAALAGTIWVANEEGNSLTAIDAATNKVVTTLNGIAGPHNVQAAADGSGVWAISGHEEMAIMIDPQTYAVHGAAPVGAHPAHIILSVDGKAVYVTNAEDDTVSVVDAATMQPVATVPVGDYPHGLRPSPDGRWVYVANMNAGTVSVIDTQNNTKVADIEVGEMPVQVGFAPDGKSAYVSLNGEDAVAQIDVATQTVSGKAETGRGPLQVFVTPDSQTLLVANQGTEDNPNTTVSFIDTRTLAEVAQVESGAGAHGVVVEPSGRYAYVTNLYGDSLAVIDIAAREVVATVPTGASPNGVSFLPGVVAAPPAPSVEIVLPAVSPAEHAEHHSG